MRVIIVAYASPLQQVELSVPVKGPCVVQEVLERSGLLDQFPEVDLTQQPIGIWGRKVSLQALVQPGERVEVYRPLTRDPNQARLQRARNKQTTA